MDVIDELIAHCEAWEPWARVMGNVCAGDAAQALRSLRAENAELQHELTKGIHTCGPKCRKTARCTEMADLREELVDTKAALFSAEMRAQSAEKPNCKTCDHYIPPLSFAGEPACEFANTESVLVCIKGDAYIPADPVRLYEKEEKL